MSSDWPFVYPSVFSARGTVWLTMAIEPPPTKFKDHDPMLLGIAFKRLLERVPKAFAFTITIDSVSIVERMMKVMEILKSSKGPVQFDKLIPDLTSRSSMIGSFVALLELCKRRAIKVRQDDIFKEIVVALASDDFDSIGMTSEFDDPKVAEN